METILGVVVIYVWIHGAIIVGMKVQDTTTYENAVLIAGAVALVMFILGVVTN